MSTRKVTLALSSAIKYSHYGKVFRQLLSIAPAARKAFNVIVAQEVRRQMLRLVRGGCQWQSMFKGAESIEDFSWANMVQTMSQELPTLYAAMTASMPRKFVNDNEEFTYVYCRI